MSEIVWNGAPALRPFLRPLAELHRHPLNPKKGDVDEIAASLNRFGQVRAILTDAADTIVAGNHTYLGAEKVGWTHIAAIPNDFASPEEARAYLVADNRLGDLGEYDRAELTLMLEDLERLGSWAGTGYQQDDLEHLRALQALADAVPLVAPEPLPPVAPPAMREVVLLLTEDQQHEFAEKVRGLRVRYRLEGVTDTVLRALHDEAFIANQAPA